MKLTIRMIEWALAICAGGALLAMMGLTFLDVIGRYGFNSSIFGTAELIEYLMVVVVFAGIAFVTAGDQHIKVDLFEPLLKRSFPILLRWTVQIFSLIVYAFLAVELAERAIDSFASCKRTAVLDAPQWMLPASAALFSAVGVALFAFAVARTRGDPAPPEQIRRPDARGGPDEDPDL